MEGPKLIEQIESNLLNKPPRALARHDGHRHVLRPAGEDRRPGLMAPRRSTSRWPARPISSARSLCTSTSSGREVGLVGKWDHFKSFGGRGKKVVESSATTGTHLSVALENNPKSYAYADKDWQAFAAHCAKESHRGGPLPRPR